MRRIFSLFLSLVLAVGCMTWTASAATVDLPDWYFLFVIFKNTDIEYEKDGVNNHVTQSLSTKDIQVLWKHFGQFQEFMAETGVMTPHIDIVELDTLHAELSVHESTGSPYLYANQLAPILEGAGINLDRYDHVTVFANMDTVKTDYWGYTTPGTPFKNGTTYSVFKANSSLAYENSGTPMWPIYSIVHEFLHNMAHRWEYFDLHAIEQDYYAGHRTDEVDRRCKMDIIHNNVQGANGTGVPPEAWRYPPHVLRTAQELTIPAGVTTIGSYAYKGTSSLKRLVVPPTVTRISDHAFQDCTGLTSVTLPSSISSIEEGLFERCASLTEVTIPSSVTSIGIWSFESCSSLTKIAIPVSVTSIGVAAFQKSGVKDVYYGGTEAQWKAIQIDGYNYPLNNATIHYNCASFADVGLSKYYTEPIFWAVRKGVTNGTGGGCFSPGATCTQGQILTFLWRAKNQPKPSGAVSGGKYYASAVQWAKEQGLVDSTLDPGVPCTRADVMTYLWRLAGSPRVGSANFSDVPANAGYAQAVAWAVQENITNGTSKTEFSPDATCTRGQIVTFLYRALA